MPRSYRLGRRQAAVDRTYKAILDAARGIWFEHGPRGLSARKIAAVRRPEPAA
jgi:AcrR family transcriptional regulator